MRPFTLLICLLLTCTLFAQDKGQKIVEANPFTHINGDQQTLLEIFKAHKGKVIYVDFWASWCGPCRQEMPASHKLHKALKGEEVVFVYISIDKHIDQWKRSMKQLDLAGLGEHYQRNQNEMVDFLRFFNIYSIPHYMIIAPSGEIIDGNAMPPSHPSVKKEIKRLLTEKS
ncbi:MAG: TlpA family protein disulfide reductase [Aureispira sp.]